MPNKRKKLFGLITFLVFSGLVYWALSLRLLVPLPVTRWLNQSKQPALATFLFSTSITSAAWLLVWLGIEIPTISPFTKKNQEEKSEEQKKLWSYVFGMPIWATIFLGLASISGLWFIRPICESPAIVFNVQSNDDYSYSGFDITLKPNTSIILEASSVNDDLLNCNWSYVGKAIQSLSPTMSCTTMISVKNADSQAIVTLVASKGLCTQITSIPLQLIIKDE